MLYFGCQFEQRLLLLLQLKLLSSSRAPPDAPLVLPGAAPRHLSPSWRHPTRPWSFRECQPTCTGSLQTLHYAKGRSHRPPEKEKQKKISHQSLIWFRKTEAPPPATSALTEPLPWIRGRFFLPMLLEMLGPPWP